VGRPAVFGAADASERASEMFLRTGAFFSSILSEFLKNLVALQLSPLCSDNIRGKIILNIANKPALRGWLVCFFTGRSRGG
jgi:hypothetical protein